MVRALMGATKPSLYYYLSLFRHAPTTIIFFLSILPSLITLLHHDYIHSSISFLTDRASCAPDEDNLNLSLKFPLLHLSFTSIIFLSHIHSFFFHHHLSSQLHPSIRLISDGSWWATGGGNRNLGAAPIPLDSRCVPNGCSNSSQLSSPYPPKSSPRLLARTLWRRSSPSHLPHVPVSAIWCLLNHLHAETDICPRSGKRICRKWLFHPISSFSPSQVYIYRDSYLLNMIIDSQYILSSDYHYNLFVFSCSFTHLHYNMTQTTQLTQHECFLTSLFSL